MCYKNIKKASKEVFNPPRGFISASSEKLLSYLTLEGWSHEIREIEIMGIMIEPFFHTKMW